MRRVYDDFAELLLKKRSVAQVEITDNWLRRAGGSAAALFWMLERMGYTPFSVSNELRLRTALKLIRLDAPLPTFEYDVVFLPKPSWKRCWLGS